MSDIIAIEVKDSIAPTIVHKLDAIEKLARSGQKAVDRLQKALNGLQPRGLTAIASTATKAQQALDKTAISSARLATEQQKTALTAARVAAAQTKAASAAAKLTADEARAATATLKADQAQARAAASAARLAASNDKAAAAAARSAAATAAQTRNLAANEIEVSRVQGIHDRFNQVLARNPKYQQNFTSGLNAMGKSAKLRTHELANLSYQVNDVVVSLGSGQRPMQVLLQQGAQIGQIFGSSGVGAGAIFKQLAGIVGSLLLRLAPFAAVATAALAPFSLFTREINKGLKTDELVKGLKLTEEQLEKLKKSGESTAVTFGDTFKAAFQVVGSYIGQYFAPQWEWVKNIITKALDFITAAFSVWIRMTIGNMIGLYNAIKVIWSDLPNAIGYFAVEAGNALITQMEKAINVVAQLLANSPMGKMMGIEVGAIEIPKIDNPYAQTGADIQAAFSEGQKAADKFVTQFGQDVAAQAKKNAQDRIKNAAGEADKKDKKGGRGRGFDEVAELKAINDQLDAQAKHMFALSSARDAFNRVEEIAIKFAKEGKPLSEATLQGLREKIQALNDAKYVQQEFDRIYESGIEPARTRNSIMEAANKLLAMGAIDQDKYNAELARADKQYAESATAFGKLNIELDEQLKLMRLLPAERDIEQQMIQAVNDAIAAGKPIRDEEIKALREKLQLTREMTIAADLMAESQRAQSQGISEKIGAAGGAVGRGDITKGDAVNSLAGDIPGLEQTTAYWQAQQDGFAAMYAHIDELRQQDLISEQDAQKAKFATFQTQSQQYFDAASGALSALTALQGSENKKQAAIGKKAAIAQTIISTYQSATSAFSSLAGIPFVGPVLGAIAAAAAVAGGLANVQKIRSQGYYHGGYTGNAPRTAEAGVVHGQEYVFDAEATRRIGVSNLEAMRNGALAVSQNVPQQGVIVQEEAGNNRQTNNAAMRRNYNQSVTIIQQGRADRTTPEQTARALRRQTAKELGRG